MELGELLRRQRISLSLTKQELAARSEVSQTYLGKIERGERFPSARILRKIAGPLGLDEHHLFVLAGYMSPDKEGKGLDPYVAGVLSQEPVNVQRAVVAILTILKILREIGKSK